MPRKKTTKAGINKLDAMRQALSELGNDAPPLTIQPFLKERFGLEMSRDYISKYKSHVVTEQRKGKKPAAKKLAVPAPAKKPAAPAAAKKPAAPAAARATAAPKAETKSAPAGGISLHDIEATQVLVGRVGADALKKLIDLLAR